MFLGQMDKPDVDYIDGLSPAISIDQKTTSSNPRSTVGTVTEIYDYLRLLWARVGTPHCPKCGKEIRQQTHRPDHRPDDGAPGGDAHSAAGAGRPRQEGRARQRCSRTRARAAMSACAWTASIYDLTEEIKLDKNKKHTIEIVVDRLVMKPDHRRPPDGFRGDGASRSPAALSSVDVDRRRTARLIFSQNYACDGLRHLHRRAVPRGCSRSTTPTAPARCCTGLGIAEARRPGSASFRTATFPSSEGAIRAPGWGNADGEHHRGDVLRSALGKKHGFTLDTSHRGALPSRHSTSCCTAPEGEPLELYDQPHRAGVMRQPFEGIITEPRTPLPRDQQSSGARGEIEEVHERKSVPGRAAASRLRPEVLAVTRRRTEYCGVCGNVGRQGAGVPRHARADRNAAQ